MQTQRAPVGVILQLLFKAPGCSFFLLVVILRTSAYLGTTSSLCVYTVLVCAASQITQCAP